MFRNSMLVTPRFHIYIRFLHVMFIKSCISWKYCIYHVNFKLQMKMAEISLITTFITTKYSVDLFLQILAFLVPCTSWLTYTLISIILWTKYTIHCLNIRKVSTFVKWVFFARIILLTALHIHEASESKLETED